MNYQDYIKSELLVLVPILYFIGIVLKKSSFPDKLIPTAIGIISTLLSAFWVVSTSDITSFKNILYALFTSVTQGILIAGASVYANQLYIQSKKEE